MAQKTRSAGDATSKPDYGEEGQPQPTGVNRTDAEGIDSSTQIGAAEGESAELAAARMRVEAADAAAEPFVGKSGRLPFVLKSALDVRRGEKVFRIPAGTVLGEAELTDEEYDHALFHGIVGEATVADLAAQQQRDQVAASDEKAKAARRDAVEGKPKKASGDKPPKGAALMADLEQGALLQAQAKAAQQVALNAHARH